ncbi:MAG: cyclophilin-like family protein [Hyphomicrobiaceae bacterium]
MPTNLLRKAPQPKQAGGPKLPPDAGAPRRASLEISGRRFEIVLHDTPTAHVMWRALPLFAVGETWGESLHFEVPVRAGRDRTARLNGRPGELYFWADDARIVLVWGPTPISCAHEIRLMRPCNVWGHTDDDLSVLSGIVPGAKVALRRTA